MHRAFFSLPLYVIPNGDHHMPGRASAGENLRSVVHFAASLPANGGNCHAS